MLSYHLIIQIECSSSDIRTLTKKNCKREYTEYKRSVKQRGVIKSVGDYNEISRMEIYRSISPTKK